MSRKSKQPANEFWIAPNFSMSKNRPKPPAAFASTPVEASPSTADDDRRIARFLELADIALSGPAKNH